MIYHKPRNGDKRKRNNIDWEDIRAKSLKLGGFGSERVHLWTKLLNVVPTEARTEKDQNNIVPPDSSPHQDERQIALDTDRSFVLYPVDTEYDKETLQSSLRELLVSLFRIRPRLHYFQGYHDVASVIFLTMPEELRLSCIEKVSLHRLRDSMGAGLEPVLGLLRVTKNLIRLKDVAYADVLERHSPLPFHALSNLLTLFSHDMPTLPLIQHVFDYLLCRPPIITVYLATTIILARKQEVFRLEEEGDDGMIHSLLCNLPKLSDDEIQANSSDSLEQFVDGTDYSTLNLNSEITQPVLDDVLLQVDDRDQSVEKRSTQETKPSQRLAEVIPAEDHFIQPSVLSENAIVVKAKSSEESKTDGTSSEHEGCEIRIPTSQLPLDLSMTDRTDDQAPTDNADSVSLKSSLTETHPASQEEQSDGESQNCIQPQQTVRLIDLLSEADALYAEFPPSHLELGLSSIMGPQSVVFTWSESFSELPSEREAEAMVQHPNLIVYPHVDIEGGESSGSSEYGEETKSRKKIKENRREKSRRKKHTKTLNLYSQVDKGTIAAGAILVAGVAVVAYGIRTRHDDNGLFVSFASAQGHATTQTQEWKRVGSWMSGAFNTFGEKVVHVFDRGS